MPQSTQTYLIINQCHSRLKHTSSSTGATVDSNTHHHQLVLLSIQLHTTINLGLYQQNYTSTSSANATVNTNIHQHQPTSRAVDKNAHQHSPVPNINQQVQLSTQIHININQCASESTSAALNIKTQINIKQCDTQIHPYVKINNTSRTVNTIQVHRGYPYIHEFYTVNTPCCTL